MSYRSHNGRRADEALDDVTVEELLGGRYEGDAPDLVAVDELLAELRSLGEQPAPLPSPSLARMLRDAPVANGGLPTPADRHRRWPSRGPRVASAVAAAVVAAAVIVVAAGSARLLPGSTQNVVAEIVRTVTPFDFPDHRKPESVVSKAPTAETAAPSDAPASRSPGGPWLPGPGDPGTSGDHGVGPDAPGNRPQPRGATPLPTPATTVPRASSGSPPEVASSVPSPPPPRHSLRAELTGTTGAETAGDPDGRATATLSANPGHDELCLTVVVSGVAPVTVVHLHAEAGGIGGPDVAAWTEATGECVTVPGEVIRNIRKQPGEYYVDVHTAEFPNGALRGPLAKL